MPNELKSVSIHPRQNSESFSFKDEAGAAPTTTRIASNLPHYPLQIGPQNYFTPSVTTAMPCAKQFTAPSNIVPQMSTITAYPDFPPYYSSSVPSPGPLGLPATFRPGALQCYSPSSYLNQLPRPVSPFHYYGTLARAPF